MKEENRIREFWREDKKRFFYSALHSIISKTFLTYICPDSLYLKFFYYKRFGKKLDLKNPLTLNEKLQWLKLNNRKDIYTRMVDKVRVKDYVREKIGDQFIIKTLGVWDRFDDIDFDTLPNQFVLKCNHDSGNYIICPDKAKLDKEKAKNILEKALKKNFFYTGREWPYKNVKPKILAEEFIGKDGKVPEDYKLMCINGVFDNIMVCTDRQSGTTKYYFFDKAWKLIRCNKWGELAPQDFSLEKPEKFDTMVEIAEKLSYDIPLTRIDLYEVDGKIYFGEITFFPNSGFDTNLYYQEDLRLGQKLDLKKVGRN
ncbi:MAG: ATP-grasp fold amidoligase family protein [Peptoniphilaceae bacterium]|nr:ATP-grasp fold amidoligase family protein [Peptoniphilaceae bacterium]MDY6018497.1 ATP-grasp fold amidoligase family protein [Anaerococcus sp.]